MTDAAAPSSPDAEYRSIQAYARFAGVLGLITIVAGGFGEAYVPGAILVSGNASATAQHLLAHQALFRWGFAGYLLEGLCDAALTIAFWVLVRPVSRNLAMLMVVFRIISTCGFAASQVLYFAALPTLRAAQAAGAPTLAQAQDLAYLLLRTSVFGGSLFGTFYGVANLVFGWLICRSGYLPRVFGIALLGMGAAFVAHTFLLILAPAYASDLLLATAAVGFIPIILWLLVKGVDEEGWQRVRATA